MERKPESRLKKKTGGKERKNEREEDEKILY
jgi:hypothetical protein